MIMSSNRAPSLGKFAELVASATNWLNNDAKKNTSYYLNRNAQKLEEDVLKALRASSQGTDFANSIEKISGQKFPDIVAGKFYGVEVKSSKDDKWLSLGGSANESTRVDNVGRVFLIFGKLVEPVEFRSRPYEACLSEVVATHYPRYKINMNLKNGETIFDKMNTTYDALRTLDNPVGEIVKYYKGQLKPGESLWWIDSSSTEEENVTASMTVRLWSTLSEREKQGFTTSLYTLFPEILSTTSNKKYGRAVLWLASRHGVVDAAFRDKFSAGGKVTIVTQSGAFENLPQVFSHIQSSALEIQVLLNSTHKRLLSEMWGVSTIESDRLLQWIDLVAMNHQAEKYNCAEVLKAIFEMSI
ncbi:MAG: hypothetical protein FWB97_10075 [Oscillospiraceae bacterium]|nr:hypothetical protein [Oscillospiraceae bacterium]